MSAAAAILKNKLHLRNGVEIFWPILDKISAKCHFKVAASKNEEKWRTVFMIFEYSNVRCNSWKTVERGDNFHFLCIWCFKTVFISYCCASIHIHTHIQPNSDNFLLSTLPTIHASKSWPETYSSTHGLYLRPGFYLMFVFFWYIKAQIPPFVWGPASIWVFMVMLCQQHCSWNVMVQLHIALSTLTGIIMQILH